MTLEIPREKHGSNMSTMSLNYGDFEQNVFIQTLKKTNHQKNWGNIASLRKVYISMVGLNFRSYLVSQSGCILWWEPLPIYWLSASSFQTNQPTPGYLSPHRLRNDDGFQISPFPQLLFKILRATTKNRDSWPIIKIRDQISSSRESLWGLFGGR